MVAARFNEVVTAKLVEGALAGLAKHGVADDDVDVAWVPGAFEIPLVAERLARSGRYDAVICLGAVIRGETAHFELVANEAARGIAAGRCARRACRSIFEVLATDDLAQAEARAGRGTREQGMGSGGGRPRDGVAPRAAACRGGRARMSALPPWVGGRRSNGRGC